MDNSTVTCNIFNHCHKSLWTQEISLTLFTGSLEYETRYLGNVPHTCCQILSVWNVCLSNPSNELSTGTPLA